MSHDLIKYGKSQYRYSDGRLARYEDFLRRMPRDGVEIALPNGTTMVIPSVQLPATQTAIDEARRQQMKEVQMERDGDHDLTWQKFVERPAPPGMTMGDLSFPPVADAIEGAVGQAFQLPGELVAPPDRTAPAQKLLGNNHDADRDPDEHAP